MMDRGSERIDRVFEFALVILSVLAAAEFQYVCSVPERQAEIPYAFRALTYPIISLVMLWIVREAVVLTWSPRHAGYKMAYTEFCWAFWASTLFNYLIWYSLFAFGDENPIRSLFLAALTGLLVLTISIGYERTQPGMVYFRRRQARIIRSLFIFALAYGLTWLLLRP